MEPTATETSTTENTAFANTAPGPTPTWNQSAAATAPAPEVNPKFADTPSGRLFRGSPLAKYVGARAEDLPPEVQRSLRGPTRAMKCWYILFGNGSYKMYWASEPPARELAIELIKCGVLVNELMDHFRLTRQDVDTSPQSNFRERGY